MVKTPFLEEEKKPPNRRVIRTQRKAIVVLGAYSPRTECRNAGKKPERNLDYENRSNQSHNVKPNNTPRMVKGDYTLSQLTSQMKIQFVFCDEIRSISAWLPDRATEIVAFRCDGAPWIWDRLNWVRKRLGLSDKQVSLGLDWCHAVHHVGLALEPVLAGAERKRVQATGRRD